MTIRKTSYMYLKFEGVNGTSDLQDFDSDKPTNLSGIDR